ncbi:MAG: diacylglycerol/lipid kinase family protein [bacterium]
MVTETEKETLVIINPNAGRRRGEKDWDEISALLKKAGFNYKAVFTQYPRHAIGISASHIKKGYKNLIVVGGDGTMNEVINGIFSQNRYPTTEISLGMITVGTGNDWARMFNIPGGYAEAISVIKRNNGFVQDAGVVKYYQGIEQKCRYFVNIAGIGFDALVVSKTNKMKENGKGGAWTYLKSIIISLMKYRHTRTKIRIDNHEISNDVFNISIGICKYNGGGMMQLPHAVANDGFFDVTVINKIKKHEVILNLKRLYNGTITKHHTVESYKGKSIFIDSEPIIHLETDGESLGHSPFIFEIIPRSIKILTTETV